MKHSLLLLIPLLAVAGCASQQTVHKPSHPISREMRKNGVGPEYFQVTDKDAEIRQAVHDARRTVGKFIAALRQPAPGQHDFQVKKLFVQGGNVEHIWLANVTYSGNRFHGYVDNTPVNIHGLKLGQRVSVNPDEITDWAYVDNGRLVGGYTIRVFCSSCEPDRKARLEKEGNFRIDNQ